VQDHDKRAWLRQIVRHKRKHPESAGVGAEFGGFFQPARAAPQPVRETPQAFDFVQFRQVTQKFDIIGQGHGGSLFIAL
jgi:hypothetical protein